MYSVHSVVNNSDRLPLGSFLVASFQCLAWRCLCPFTHSKLKEPGFEAIITTDQNLRYQQNLTQRNLAILVLRTTSWPRIRPHIEKIIAAVSHLSPNDYVELAFPQNLPR